MSGYEKPFTATLKYQHAYQKFNNRSRSSRAMWVGRALSCKRETISNLKLASDEALMLSV